MSYNPDKIYSKYRKFNVLLYEKQGMIVMIHLKKRLADFFSHFTNQVVFIFITTIVLVISITVFLFYNSTKDTIRKDAIQGNQTALSLLNKNFENYLNTIQNFAMTVRTDEKLLSIITNGDRTYSEYEYLSNYIKTMFYSRQDISKITFYLPVDRKSYSYSKTAGQVTISDEINMKSEQWYKGVTQNQYYAYVQPCFDSNKNFKFNLKDNLFTVYRAIINVYTKETIAVVAITCNSSILSDMVADQQTDPGSMICLFDNNQRIYYVSDEGLLDLAIQEGLKKNTNRSLLNSYFSLKISRDEYLAIYNITQKSNWQIVKLVSIKALNEKNTQSKNLSLLILFLAIGLSVVIIIIIVQTLTSSLNVLAKQMRLAGKGDLKTTVKEKGSYEIVMLVHRYNTMIQRIDELIQTNYVLEIKEKAARLSALESQINPHFLYNALQVISTKAILNDQDEIYKMIEALALNLRYGLKEEPIVTVEQEMKHVLNYLYILKYRYDRRLTYDIDVESTAIRCKIPKISIYSLVENSAKHALEKTMSELSIRIKIRLRKKQLIICISDNGPGIIPERLQEMKQWFSQEGECNDNRDDIGLKNLYGRIKMLFGPNANLLVNSRPNHKTSTMIILPVNSIGEEKDV